MKKGLLLASLLIFFLSCNNSKMYEQIAGVWECDSWTNETMGTDKCNNNVQFEFKLDKTYNSTIAKVSDTGMYKIQGELLYISPNGKMEFAVKITKLTSDTLVFLMNQAGNEEILTLLRTN